MILHSATPSFHLLIVCADMNFIRPSIVHNFQVSIFLLVVGFIWSTGACVGFMSDTVPEDRKALGVYPVWLFYVAIAWMILLALIS
ncbi:unnamed protein product [Amoebophrya sp. A25]|nr:unnamed protein product [Amoebophrya sp. A25]|eukprot:GSA25T00006451001.1